MSSMTKSAITLTAIFSLLRGGGRASAQQPASPSSLGSLEGTYRGFAPTDESAVMMGEMEIVISRESVSVRMATGLKIETHVMKLSDFVPMAQEDVAAEYKPGAPVVSSILGFKMGDSGLKFLFMKDVMAEGPGLIVRTGGMGEMLGPTILFTPAQVARGDFDKVISEIEKEAGKNVLPRISKNGKAK
ncbi:MAG: hypothetical protein JWN50_1 [Parcubacteria group bacterium]|nr:hypothetical protein [Parcubacteria group bacterium]